MKALLLACVLLAGCDSALHSASATADDRDSSLSIIRPQSPFSSGLSQLVLSQPRMGASVTGPIAFVFDTSGAPQGLLLLFDREPKLVDGRLQGGWDSSGCLGGIASMAAMTWNGTQILDSLPHRSGLHACGQTDREPLDTSRPLTLKDLPEGKLWWVVIGYDAHFHPTATSPAYVFNWRNES